jgi:hypothetical protein
VEGLSSAVRLDLRPSEWVLWKARPFRFVSLRGLTASIRDAVIWVAGKPLSKSRQRLRTGYTHLPCSLETERGRRVTESRGQTR